MVAGAAGFLCVGSRISSASTFAGTAARPCLLGAWPLHTRRRAASLRGARSMVPEAMPAGSVFFLDEFAARQWSDQSISGTRIPTSVDKADFVAKVHELHASGSAPLVEGYAPFCKHLFVPNWVGAKVGALAITEENRAKIRSGYTKRRPEELAVLARWFPEEAVQPVPEAKYLDIILYSREQLVKEYEDMPSKNGGGGAASLPNAPWGIISIKGQDEDHETPMQPITIMRNSLGRDEGGSGVKVDREAYEASVLFWETHAAVVAGDPGGE